MTGTRFPNCPNRLSVEYADESLKTESTKLGSMSVSCLICGTPVPMENPRDCPKICEKCKEAVMFAQKMMTDCPVGLKNKE